MALKRYPAAIRAYEGCIAAGKALFGLSQMTGSKWRGRGTTRFARWRRACSRWRSTASRSGWRRRTTSAGAGTPEVVAGRNLPSVSGGPAGTRQRPLQNRRPERSAGQLARGHDHQPQARRSAQQSGRRLHDERPAPGGAALGQPGREGRLPGEPTAQAGHRSPAEIAGPRRATDQAPVCSGTEHARPRSAHPFQNQARAGKLLLRGRQCLAGGQHDSTARALRKLHRSIVSVAQSAHQDTPPSPNATGRSARINIDSALARFLNCD